MWVDFSQQREGPSGTSLLSLLYGLEGEPLPEGKGGPFRLITPGLGDLCANVKGVGRIEVRIGSGKDTRPSERPLECTNETRIP